MPTDIAVICPVFGLRFTHFYNAPKNYDSFIFTNNPSIKPIIEKAGWKYVFVDMPLTDDDLISTMQSKYVKFLQFLNDKKFSDFKKYGRIIHTDHKLELKDRHIRKIVKIQNKPVLQRNHRVKRTNIWQEVAGSMQQERYSQHARDMVDYICKKIDQGYTDSCAAHQLCTNGLLSYHKPDNPKTRRFLSEVYNDGCETEICQDQIIWFMVAQKYSDIIHVIDWHDLDIRWRDPAKSEWILPMILKLRRKDAHTILLLFGLIPFFKIKRKKPKI